MAFLRVSHPNRPIVLLDLGPAHGQRHPWELMRKTIDDAKAYRQPSHPMHNVPMERPR